MAKKTKFEKSLDELPTDIRLNFGKKKWSIKDLILYLIKENKRLSKSQCTPSFNCYHQADDYMEEMYEKHRENIRTGNI